MFSLVSLLFGIFPLLAMYAMESLLFEPGNQTEQVAL